MPNKGQKPKPQNVLPKPSTSKIELKKKRTPFTNTYLNPDGSFSVEVSSQPINYKNISGNWKNIDNTLVTKAKNGYGYTNLANSFTVRFAKNNQNDKLVYVTIDDKHWLAFSPTVRFTQIGTTKDNTILYKNVKQGVDLQYAVNGDTLKENIILNSYPGSNIFSFDISYGGLRLEKQANGSIAAIDNDTGQIHFIFPKPSVMDANGDVTDSGDMSIVKDISKERLVISVNPIWLINAAYPVTIDPIILPMEGYDIKNIWDTFIASGYPTSSFYSYPNLHVGYLVPSSYNITRSLIMFKYLPALPPGAKVTSAYLQLFMWQSYSNPINVYKITSQWSVSGVSWNNQPSIDSTNPLVTNFTGYPVDQWDIDITAAANDWYTANAPNYGVMIKAYNENWTPTSFYSSNEEVYNKPKMTINYKIDALGLEPYFGFHGNVNVYNGNLVLTDVDISLPGRGIPIIISRTYNLRSDEASVLGSRWIHNFLMKLTTVHDEIVVLTDGDGTEKIFTLGSDLVYYAPTGVYEKLYKSGSDFILEEQSGVKYTFNSQGFLQEIEDTNGNTTTIAYQSGNISTITDATGRQVSFSYVSGKLDTITGTDITKVKYTYSGDNLINVKLLDSQDVTLKEVTYAYDDVNKTITITDSEGNTTDITYYDTAQLGRRVYQIKKKLTIDSEQQILTTSYSYQLETSGVTTTITDPKGYGTEYYVTEYKTDDMGHIISVTQDVGGENIKTEFLWSEQQNLTGVIAPKGTPYDPQVENEYLTVLEYDDSGKNLTKYINRDNNSIVYDYNVLDDPKEIKDYAGIPTINDYDTANRNLLMSSTPLFSTNIMDYDSYGNLISQTDPLGLAGNLVPNAGFENFDASNVLRYWTKVDSGMDITVDSTETVNGKYSVKLVSAGDGVGQEAVLLSSYMPISESFKYNISWYVKLQNSGVNNGIASVDVYWYNQSQQVIGSQTNLAPASTDTDIFIRLGIRVDAPATAYYARLKLVLNGGASNSQSTAWFDNMQFEYGTVINKYNLVYNGGFEIDAVADGFPEGWDQSGLDTYQADPQDLLVTNEKHSGIRSFKLTGSASPEYLFQYIYEEGEKGVPFHFSGWSKATGTLNQGGEYQLKLQFNFQGSEVGTVVADFTTIDSQWHYVEKVAIAPDKFDNVRIFCWVENFTGDVWFDDIKVRLEGAPNAMMSSYNIAQNGSFEYYSPGDVNYNSWVVNNTTTQAIWISQDGEIKPFSGNLMIKVYDTTSWVTLVNTVKEPIKTGTTYTLCAAIKANNVSGSGAMIKFDISDINGNYLGQKVSEVITGTTEWIRIVLTITEAEAKAINANAAYIRAAIGTLGATSGAMYFDAVRMSQGNDIISFGYDVNNNYLDEVTNQKYEVLSMVNDSRGNTTQITDPKNNTYTMQYDDLDNLKRSENPEGLISYYDYDENENLKTIKNYKVENQTEVQINTAIEIVYNELQLPKQIYNPERNITDIEYDKNANITDIAMPNGKKIHFAYDHLNRVTGKTYTGDNTTWDYVYDKNSNITQAKKNTTEITSFIYDNMDRAISKTMPPVNGTSNNSQYTYNQNSQLLNIMQSILPSGDQNILYTYDQAGNNTDVIAPNNSSSAFMVDEEGRLKKKYVSYGSMSYSTYRDYDEASRVIGMRTVDKTGVPVFDYSYEYDANGNKTKEINILTEKRVEYTYDNINQLKEERYYDTLITTTPYRKYTYDYDLMGNRTVKNVEGTGATTYQYDSENIIQSMNESWMYTHDENGNMTASGTFSFYYNPDNQLIKIEQSGNELASYEYNWQGLRSKKVTPSKTEYYYYTGNDLEYITDGSNNLKYYFVRDTNGVLLQMIDYSNYPTTAAKTYTYIRDLHGNIVALADESGNKVLNYEYDAWGLLLNTPETVTTANGELLSNANPFRYSGYQYDPETGLYYLKYRYYSAGIGRFLTRDPMFSRNRYAYVGNNCVNFVDPLGLWYATPEDTSYTGNNKKDKNALYLNANKLETVGNFAGTETSAISALSITAKYYWPKAIRNTTLPKNIGSGLAKKMIEAEAKRISNTMGRVNKITSSNVSTAAIIYVDAAVGINKNMKSGVEDKRIFTDAFVDVSFGLGGVITMTLSGAAAGSVIPGPGTVVGALGGFAGGIVYMITTDLLEINEKSIKDRVKEFMFSMLK